MPNNDEFTALVLENLLNEPQIGICSHYGEKGYTDPEKGIVFADWNHIPDNVTDYLENEGYSIEWSDEWYIDYDNSKAYRTSPDGYGWECLVHYTQNGQVLTPDDDLSDWLDEICVTDHNQPHKALNCSLLCEIGGDISEHGYTLLNDDDKPYQSGLHVGMNDNPQQISKKMFEELDGLESLVYVITETSQFYVQYEVWGKFE